MDSVNIVINAIFMFLNVRKSKQDCDPLIFIFSSFSLSLLALDFLAHLLQSEDETIIGNTALCLGHCADMSKLQTSQALQS